MCPRETLDPSKNLSKCGPSYELRLAELGVSLPSRGILAEVASGLVGMPCVIKNCEKECSQNAGMINFSWS